MAEPDDLSQFEARADAKDTSEADAVRKVIANVYTFVRSVEINKTIASFTLDHYIDEAKRKIKDSRVLRAASDPTKGVGTRSSQIDALTKLEQDFNNAFEKAKKVALQKDEGTVEAQ